MIPKFGTAWKILREDGLAVLLLYAWYRMVLRLAALPRLFFRLDLGRDPVRRGFEEFFEAVNRMPGPRVLELGSCNHSRKGSFTSFSEYVGFDVHSGPNVDVVGDIHRLSESLPQNHFDVVYAISVFEHLAMPWKAVQEINKVLKPGGTLFIFTHHTFPLHAEPWDFWRYSRDAFRVLLNRRTGFEILKTDLGWPCLVLPLESEESIRRTHTVLSYMGISVTATKAAPGDPALRWELGEAAQGEGAYPLDAATPQRTEPFIAYMRSRGKVAANRTR